MHSPSLKNSFGWGTSWTWLGNTPPMTLDYSGYFEVHFCDSQRGWPLDGCRFSLEAKPCLLTLPLNTWWLSQCFPHPIPLHPKGAVSKGRYVRCSQWLDFLHLACSLLLFQLVPSSWEWVGGEERFQKITTFRK